MLPDTGRLAGACGRAAGPPRWGTRRWTGHARYHQESVSKKSVPPSTSVPLVLHVLPTRVARGAQREARAVADQLDRPGVRSHRLLSLFDGPPEVEVEHALDYPWGGTSWIGFDPRFLLRLRSELARLDPTVVVAHGSEPLKCLVPAGVGRRSPLLYYAIGTYSGSSRRSQVWAWRFLVGRAQLVAAVGPEVRLECIDLLGVPPQRVLLASNGRDPEVFHPRVPGAASSPPLVVFVGALTRGKRPDRFVDMVTRLRDEGIPLRAELIGRGPLQDELVDVAHLAHIDLLGSRADVADLIRRADILVFTSRPEGEGMPGILIEAGLSGIPVVATDVPGVRSVVADGETGLVVGVDDLPGMTAAVSGLLVDPARRAVMGRAARDRCFERFSMDAVGTRWEAMLEPLLESRRPVSCRR
jgi:glycosyltransferase involved in cell wall biosynthesis